MKSIIFDGKFLGQEIEIEPMMMASVVFCLLKNGGKEENLVPDYKSPDYKPDLFEADFLSDLYNHLTFLIFKFF